MHVAPFGFKDALAWEQRRSLTGFTTCKYNRFKLKHALKGSDLGLVTSSCITSCLYLQGQYALIRFHLTFLPGLTFLPLSLPP